MWKQARSNLGTRSRPQRSRSLRCRRHGYLFVRVGSEGELGSQLNVARGQSVTADRAEGRRVQSRIWSGEMRRVEKIEHVRLELQLAMLRAQRGGLSKGEVPVIDSRRADRFARLSG